MLKKILLSAIFIFPACVFFSWYVVNIFNPYNIPPYSTYVILTFIFAILCILISMISKRVLSDNNITKVNNIIFLTLFFLLYSSTLFVAHFFKHTTIETNFVPGYVINYFLSAKFLNEFGIVPFVRYLFYFGVKFVPLAFVLPFLFRTMRKPIFFAITLAFVSFGFELLQSLTRTGSSYIDDALVGFCGGMIAYLLSLLLIRRSLKFKSFLKKNFLWNP